MTVNLSINDLINKNYDVTKYRKLINNGVLTNQQAKIIMIIKNIQDNNILLSNKEKIKLKEYISKFSFNSDNLDQENILIDDQENILIDDQENILINNKNTDNDNLLINDKDTDNKNLLINDTDNKNLLINDNDDENIMLNEEEKPITDPNLLTCPAKKKYRIKYIHDQNKLKRLALIKN